MRYILFCLLVFWGVSNLKAQKDSLKLDQLDNIGLYSFPNQEDLIKTSLDDEWMDVQEIITEDINQDFNNIEDINWLQVIAKENKVMMLGENHYYKFTHNLRNRIFFALNTFDSYPLIVLENQYSITGYVNHYLAIKEENEARKFFIDELNTMIHTKEDSVLLQHIRAWNLKYPDKTLKVGYSDIEHDYRTTIKKVIIPYFQKAEEDLKINVADVTVFDLGKLVKDLRNKLQKVKNKNVVGEYPFLTWDYIRSVIDNIESLYKSYHYEFSYYRQKAMIRNITSTEFLGKFWMDKKVFIHAGSYHTPSKFEYPDNGNFYREGSYLSYEFPYTKGKTYSILTIGQAKSLNNMADINLKDCLHVGSGYKRSIAKFQKAYKKKLIEAEDSFFEWKLGSLDSLVLKKAIDKNHKGILIKDLKWTSILEKIKSFNKDEYKSLKETHNKYNR